MGRVIHLVCLGLSLGHGPEGPLGARWWLLLRRIRLRGECQQMSSIVMVTGASGHIGSHIVRQLVAQGRRVRAVYMGQDETLSGLDIERVQADITDPGALSRAMSGVEIVYHLAAV